jgi:hypothetical protein
MACSSQAAVTHGVFNSTHSVYLPTTAASVDASLSHHMLVVSSLWAGSAQCWRRGSSLPSASLSSDMEQDGSWSLESQGIWSQGATQQCSRRQLQLEETHPALNFGTR